MTFYHQRIAIILAQGWLNHFTVSLGQHVNLIVEFLKQF